MKKTTALLLILTAFLINPNFAQAQTAQGITAIPPRIEVTVKPGKVVTHEIKIRNDSASPRTISFDVKDFIVSDAIGTPIAIEGISEDTNRWAASNWVHVSASRVSLKANETKALTVTIIAPDKATAGGHYAMILQTPDNADTTINGTGSIVTTRIGTLLYITVPGNINEEAKITSFTSPSFLEYGPVNFKSTITNLSDVHILPVGSVIIKDLFGFKVGQIPLPETRIFPLNERNFDINYPQKWLLGRFSAQLNAIYGSKGQLLTATTFFWVIPWRLIILIIAAVIVAYALVLIVRQQTISQSEVKAEKLEKELEQLKKKYQDRK
jgi:hypothetical protein